MHEAEVALRNTRYERLRVLGHGASGVVYRAHDPARAADVALKVSRSIRHEEAYRLKREFRVRADIEHPNLVELHELEVRPSLAFYSMELVEGVTFDRTVELERRDRGRLLDTTLAMVRQVGSALLALDARGVTHGDVKPHNVMITPSARVVLIDFDLSSRNRGLDARLDSSAAEMVGTLAYMAPEVALGADTSFASDVYSLAATAFEAVTGAPPHFREDTAELVTLRLNAAPLLGEDLRRSHPALYAFLSRALEPDAARRPTPGELAHLLELSPPAGPVSAGFYGRRSELARIRERTDGEYHAFVVEGASGIGKTTLVERALDERQREKPGLTLFSRCYPAERVPFNAIDGCADGLAEFLHGQTALEPYFDDAVHLSRVFPQLVRLGLPGVAGGAEEREELLPRARAAFAKLLGRLAARLPVRLFIDDFQWCDRDSLAFLRELTRRRAAVTLFVAARAQ